jgi:hypothetical protein
MVSEQDIRALSNLDDLGNRLEIAAGLSTGNIVEIGGGEGINTIRFLQVADQHETLVVVVDPFEQIPGADESYFKPYSFDSFMRNTGASLSPHINGLLRVVMKPSQDPEVFEYLKGKLPIGFMFIDGLQDKESVLKDLILAQQLQAEIICVDDYDRLTESSQVPLAVIEFLKVTMYKMVNIGKREVYFIR